MSLAPTIPSVDQYGEPIYISPPKDDTAKIFLIDILAAIHRNRTLALTVAGLAALSVLAVTFFINPLYKSVASVMLDTRREQVVDMQAVLSNLPSDTFVVDSEVQVLQSPALARKVIAKLHLDKDPEFNADLQPQTIVSQTMSAVKTGMRTVMAWMGVEPVNDVNGPVRQEERVAEAFLKNLSIDRQGLTYVINITFWSQDPAKAVRIANAIAVSYLEQQKETKAQATREANGRTAAAGLCRRTCRGGLQVEARPSQCRGRAPDGTGNLGAQYPGGDRPGAGGGAAWQACCRS
jgi:uncharacterized protein involved in exopolysaccharide biosynthesis